MFSPAAGFGQRSGPANDAVHRQGTAVDLPGLCGGQRDAGVDRLRRDRVVENACPAHAMQRDCVACNRARDRPGRVLKLAKVVRRPSNATNHTERNFQNTFFA